jgi:FkbM family methyltransferase
MIDFLSKNIRMQEHYYKWLTKVAKKMENRIYGKPLLTTVRIGKEEFKMWIKGGLIEAQKTAKENQKTGAEYEFVMVECLKKLLNYLEAPVFIDIGAYMGYYCCLVAKLLEDQTLVYGIESNQEYCSCIEKSIRENKYENVRILNHILSDKIEILTSFEDTVIPACEKGNQSKTITFDNLCQNYNIKPDILKIDVHGAEGKVIAGMKNMLKEQVKFVLLELHPDDYLKNYSMGIGRREILSIFFQAGFNLYFVNGHRYLNFYERKEYVRNKKVKAVLITEENQEALFIDRFTDVFVLAVKKEIPINELDLLEIIQ